MKYRLTFEPLPLGIHDGCRVLFQQDRIVNMVQQTSTRLPFRFLHQLAHPNPKHSLCGFVEIQVLVDQTNLVAVDDSAALVVTLLASE